MYFLLSKFPSLFASLLYALCLTLFLNDTYSDYLNYLNYASSSNNIISAYAQNGVLFLLFNEPVWLLTNSLLALFFPPEIVIRLITFISSFSASFILMTKSKRPFLWILLLLVLPAIFKNYLVHIRQGLAISLFLLAIYAPNQRLKNVFLTTAPFVHSSFFFVISFSLLSSVTASLRLSLLQRLTLPIAIFSFFVPITLSISQLAGARQSAHYADLAIHASGLGFFFWTLILFIFILEGVSFLQSNYFAYMSLVFYLVSYWFLPVSPRIFESSIIMVLLSCLSFTGIRLQAFKILFMFFLSCSWIYLLSGSHTLTV